MAAAYLIPLAITFPETGRNVVGNGSIPPQGWNMSLLNYLKVRKIRKELARTTNREENRQAPTALATNRKLRWPNPMSVLRIVVEKDVAIVLFYNLLIFIAFYDIAATLPTLYKQIYNFNDLQLGLCYL